MEKTEDSSTAYSCTSTLATYLYLVTSHDSISTTTNEVHSKQGMNDVIPLNMAGISLRPSLSTLLELKTSQVISIITNFTVW